MREVLGFEEAGHGQAEPGEQGFLEEITAAEDAFEHEPVGRGMVDLDVIVAGIEDPEPGDAAIFVERFLGDGVGFVIGGADDLGGEP